jgi:hypothetical protein
VKKIIGFLFFLVLFGWSITANAEPSRVFGVVRDASDGRGLSAAEIFTSRGVVRTAADGSFDFCADDPDFIVRRPGYRPRKIANDFPAVLTLEPIQPRALYLSYWAADSGEMRERLLDLIDRTGLNALVLDLKSVRGDVAFRSAVPLAREAGAQKVRTLKDLSDFLTLLKRRGIYVIGRIAVFKDDALAHARRELAALTPEGYLFRDRDGIGWVDPFNRATWDYNIAIAEEAARLGFDEIQFDYIRFPARSDLVFSGENTGENRVAAINGFLERARARLAPYPVMTAANIFGYTCWKHKDRKIGQRLVDLADHVDYLSPMLYPSGFPHGVPGYPDPVANSYQTVALSLARARQLTGLDAVRFRPWLQAFRDYAFDRRIFGAEEIHAQINASIATGSNGWMLWNAASRFTLADLRQTLGYGRLKLADVSPGPADETIVTRADDQAAPAPVM